MKRNLHRIPHIVKSKNSFHQPSSFLFFDTETQDEYKGKQKNVERHRFWFGCAWAFRYEAGKPTRERKVIFNTIDAFWQLIKDRSDKSRPLYVMAHNLGFDLTSIDFWHTAEEYGYQPSYYVLEDPPMMISGLLDGCRVIFLDTYNYWKSSVNAMGDSLGISKHDYPKDNPDKKLWETYCFRDVEIIANQVCRLLDFLNTDTHSSFGISAASLAMNVFKAHFMKHKIFIHDRNSVLKLERSSYYGGLVLNYFVGEVKEQTIYHYDVNSLYPSVMLYQYPVKMVWSCNDVSLTEQLFSNQTLGLIATVDIESASEAYTKRIDKKMCQVTGKITTCLAGLELAQAIGRGHVKKIHCAAAYELAPIMADYVNYFWDLRAKYKKQGDGINEQFVKLLLNSFYGKWGMLGHDWVDYSQTLLREVYDHFGQEFPDTYADPEFVPSISSTCQTWHAEGLLRPIKLRYVSGKLQMQVPSGEHSESFCAIASFVTSYARCRLRELIKKAGTRQVFYCDTDSLFVTELGSKRLIAAGEVKPLELGKLKLEGTSDYALFNGPKDYIFGDKVKLKGVSKKAILQEDGTYEQQQFEGIRGILRRGAEGYIDIRTIRKKMQRKYTKGTVNANGWTTPFKLTDW